MELKTTAPTLPGDSVTVTRKTNGPVVFVSSEWKNTTVFDIVYDGFLFLFAS